MAWSPPILDSLSSPITFIIIVLCCYICYYLNSRNIPVTSVGDSPVQIAERKEYWRCVTATFSHYSFLHLIFNCGSAWELRALEQFVGSGIFLIWVTILTFLAPLCDCFIRRRFMRDSNPYAVGYSAVGFGLMTIMSTIENYMNIFGLKIPWSIMPFVSCIMMSILIPSASFVGHLSGILIGYGIRWHLFDWITVKLYFNLLPWLIVLLVINYKSSHRDQWTWLKISRKQPPVETHLEAGVLTPN